jgi:transcriptional antiterminator
MEALTPPQLSSKFGISLKTVYNYLKKHKLDLEVKKKGNKTFVTLQSFTKLLTKLGVSIPKDSKEEKEKVDFVSN